MDYWSRLIAKHNAIVIKSFAEGKKYPDRAIAFETRNFGWIWSARDEHGSRHILEKY